MHALESNSGAKWWSALVIRKALMLSWCWCFFLKFFVDICFLCSLSKTTLSACSRFEPVTSFSWWEGRILIFFSKFRGSHISMVIASFFYFRGRSRGIPHFWWLVISLGDVLVLLDFSLVVRGTQTTLIHHQLCSILLCCCPHLLTQVVI